MNTFKKLLGIALMLALLVCSVAAFASCGKKECTNHVDNNNDGKCDNEGCDADVAPEAPACTDHVDNNNDGKCDNEGCDADVEPEAPTCTKHVDANKDGVCDTEGCGASVPIPAPPAKEVTYTVTVTSGGKPLEGAEIMVGDGKGNITVTTDETGVFTLSLMNNVDWKAQVLSLPMGYVTGEDYSKKYEFSDDYKVTIDILKPNYVFYLFDDFVEEVVDEFAVAGQTVKFYKVTDEVANMSAPVATLTTDILGVCYTDIEIADYLVVTELTDTLGGTVQVEDLLSYGDLGTEEYPRYNVVASYISYVPGATEKAPIYLDDEDEDNDFDITVPAGKTVWYAITDEDITSLTFASDAIVLNYNGTEYKAAEGENSFTLTTAFNEYGDMVFSITATDAQNDTTAVASINYREGSMSNPVVLTEGGDKAVELAGLEDAYYVFTATEKCTVTVTLTGEAGTVVLVDANDEYVSPEDGEKTVSVTLEAGQAVVIMIGGGWDGGNVTFTVAIEAVVAQA